MLWIAAAAGTASACDTPVYRYAMYRWEPAPYRVFYLYREQPAKDDAGVLAQLDGLSKATPGQTATTNLRVEQVNVSKADQLDRLPEDVRSRWVAKVRREEPVFLVFTSWGAEIFGGKLTAADLNALKQSPVRRRIAEHLDQDCMTVLLVLSGKDPADTKAAEKAVAELSAQVASGKIRLGAPPSDMEELDASGLEKAAVPDKTAVAEKAVVAGKTAVAEKKPAGGGKAAVAGKTAAPEKTASGPAEAKPVRLATLSLDRADPAEVWLVRSLTAAEKEYPEFAGRAMVFPVFGRGRALAPCVDKTLTVDALAKKIDLLAGACSCTVKDQNPGVDLLFTCDWEATADKLSAKDAPSADNAPATTPGPAANAGPGPNADGRVASATTTGPSGGAAAASATGAAGSPAAGGAGGREIAAPRATVAAESASFADTLPATAPSSEAARGETTTPGDARRIESVAWLVWGIGLVLGIGAVLGVGHFMMRRPAA